MFFLQKAANAGEQEQVITVPVSNQTANRSRPLSDLFPFPEGDPEGTE